MNNAMRKGHETRAIANAIISVGIAENIDITMMKCVKLAYLAHGWTLALTGLPLSREPVLAGQYGPIFKSLFKALPMRGSTKLCRQILREDGSRAASDFSSTELAIIKRVVLTYGPRNTQDINQILQSEEGPWHRSVSRGAGIEQIDENEIKLFFSGDRREECQRISRSKIKCLKI
mgnify:CR=1 FL=1